MKIPRFISIFTTVILFFMFVGYIQASWVGAIAGLIIPLLSFALLPISLIPFAGLPLYLAVNTFFLNNISGFITISDLTFKMNLIFGALSTLICVGSSALSITLAFIIIKMGSLKLDFKNIVNISSFNMPDLQMVTLPSFRETISGKADLNGIIDQIIDIIFEIWDKIDKKLIGSVVFWFGLGIASHDFWWESSEYDTESLRPTQGTYTGLEMALAGVNVITWDLSLVDKLKKSTLMYIGLGACFVGFILTGIIPKGISRIICHIFWWAGIILMVYNWALLVEIGVKK